MISAEFAQQFVQEWLSAWNNHNLDPILDHYRDDLIMSSPRIPALADEPSGTLVGKERVVPYWKKALALNPQLHFELIMIFFGVDSVVIHYKNPRGLAAEVFFFDDQGLVTRVAANYLG